MKISFLSSALSLAGILAIAACGPSGNTPHGAVMKSVQALKENDLNTFFECSLTAQELVDVRGKWASSALETPKDSEREGFSKAMTTLTAPSAETDIMKMVEPQLAKMKPQVDMMLGMIEGMAMGAMAKSEKLTAQEQAQGRQAVQALVTTLRQNDITDPARARRAVGIVCTTARKLELKTIEDMQHLTFEQALDRGGLVMAGVKEVLTVYGFSVDQLLDSVQARTVTENGDTAMVELRYELLGVEYNQQVEMVREGGRWMIRRADDKDNVSG